MGRWIGMMLGLWLGLGLASTAQAAWFQARTKHFIVYSDGRQAQLQDMAGKLEKFDALLRKATGTTEAHESGNPMRVYLLPDDGQVKALAHNPNIGGFYRPSKRFGYAVLSREAKNGPFAVGAQVILFHEYAHHFMLENFPAGYPAWYVEGFAEFYSVIEFPKDGSIQFGRVPQHRAPALLTMSIFPLADLFARDTEGLSLRQGDRYYGTAWLVTHFFQYNERRGAEFRRYLGDLTQGKADKQVGDYFEGGLPALEKELRAYMRGRLFSSSYTPQTAIVGTTSLSPVDEAQGALVEDELRLMGRMNAEEEQAVLASVRRKAARFPASAYAATVLAEAELAADSKDAAMTAADRAIALDPGRARAHSVRAEVLLERAHDSDKPQDWKTALGAIVKANRADTEDPVPLAQFYRYHLMKGGQMPEVGYDGLYKAFTLMPQSPDYRFALAGALAHRRDYATASQLLDPLAYSPHASDMREAALRMKADLDAKAAAKAQ